MSRLCPDCSGDHRRKDCPGLALVREERVIEINPTVRPIGAVLTSTDRLIKRLTVVGYSDERMRFSKVPPFATTKPKDDSKGAWSEWLASTCSFPQSTDRLRFYWVGRQRVELGGDLRPLIGEWVEA